MRNEPWNQFKDFSVKVKLMHNLFFEKMAIFILGNSPQSCYSSTNRTKREEYRVTFLIHDYFLTHLGVDLTEMEELAR